MLDELGTGDRYMNVSYTPRHRGKWRGDGRQPGV